ncbi:ABC transporter permease [Enterocloster aldenensis]|uniref:ABC transporter permease n=1 Tax=Enterocloster aldenensis TaxID=358742 RepID=UPI000E4A22C6|nr:ABC transporter permease [Enterocloster aldenensis]
MMEKIFSHSGGQKLAFSDFYEKYGVLLVFILEMVLFSFLSDKFLSTMNILNVLRQIAMTGILAIGMTFVCITAGIDLSVGAIIAMTTVLTSAVVDGTGSTGLGILAGVGCGLAIGLLNGVGVAYGKMPPFVMTLGTTSIASGIAYLYSNGMPIMLQGDFLKLGNGMIGKVPYVVIYFVVLLIFGYMILRNTVFGRHVYAIGSNKEATRLSGISVTRTLVAVYTISGVLAGVAGIIYCSQLGIGTPIAGKGYELTAIAAVFVGGASVSGGSGTMWGTFLGAAIIGTLNNIMNLTGVNPYLQTLLSGVIIILAVLVRKNR